MLKPDRPALPWHGDGLHDRDAVNTRDRGRIASRSSHMIPTGKGQDIALLLEEDEASYKISAMQCCAMPSALCPNCDCTSLHFAPGLLWYIPTRSQAISSRGSNRQQSIIHVGSGWRRTKKGIKGMPYTQQELPAAVV